MIGRLNHVAIVVPDLAAATAVYAETLGAKVSEAMDLPNHGVTTVFVELPNTKIELLYPLGEDSPIAGFLEKNPSGGMHHVCYRVSDLNNVVKKIKEDGGRILGVGGEWLGAEGNPITFIDPNYTNGSLIELKEKI